ncbi:MAG: hypothetical protein WBG86_06365 [Polyangiales bacterium]
MLLRSWGGWRTPAVRAAWVSGLVFILLGGCGGDPTGEQERSGDTGGFGGEGVGASGGSGGSGEQPMDHSSARIVTMGAVGLDAQHLADPGFLGDNLQFIINALEWLSENRGNEGDYQILYASNCDPRTDEERCGIVEDLSELDAFYDAVDELGHLTYARPSEVPSLESYSTVILDFCAGTSIGRGTSGADLDAAMEFLRSGGRVMVAAEEGCVDTVEAANVFLSPFRVSYSGDDAGTTAYIPIPIGEQVGLLAGVAEFQPTGWTPQRLSPESEFSPVVEADGGALASYAELDPERIPQHGGPPCAGRIGVLATALIEGRVTCTVCGAGEESVVGNLVSPTVDVFSHESGVLSAGSGYEVTFEEIDGGRVYRVDGLQRGDRMFVRLTQGASDVIQWTKVFEPGDTREGDGGCAGSVGVLRRPLKNGRATYTVCGEFGALVATFWNHPDPTARFFSHSFWRLNPVLSIHDPERHQVSVSRVGWGRTYSIDGLTPGERVNLSIVDNYDGVSAYRIDIRHRHTVGDDTN